MIRKGDGCPVFGIHPVKPLRGFPEGRARIRMRPESFAMVCIKTATGITAYIPKDMGDSWQPLVEQGRNETHIVKRAE